MADLLSEKSPNVNVYYRFFDVTTLFVLCSIAGRYYEVLGASDFAFNSRMAGPIHSIRGKFLTSSTCMWLNVNFAGQVLLVYYSFN